MEEDTQVVVGDEGGAIAATPENGTWGLTEGANYAPAREREVRLDGIGIRETNVGVALEVA